MALLALASSAGLEVTAIHVDHGIRPGSSEEADIVAATAERFGAQFESRSVTVDAGPNLEERARQARYSVLPEKVLTGHTADDQAETILLALLQEALGKVWVASNQQPAVLYCNCVAQRRKTCAPLWDYYIF